MQTMPLLFLQPTSASSSPINPAHAPDTGPDTNPCTPAQIGGEYLDPELFLLQREDTTFATLWQPGNDFAGGLYYQEHWPVDYIDSMEVSKVNNR